MTAIMFQKTQLYLKLKEETETSELKSNGYIPMDIAFSRHSCVHFTNW